MTNNSSHEADSFDVVVIGSGAAGLVTACVAADAGLTVAVLEKADLLGGTSAVSGGVMWIPANHLMGEAFPDSAEQGLAYLRAATAGAVPDARLRWYVDTGHEAVRYLGEKTHVRLVPLGRPDYHPDWPGAVTGGRSLDNMPFDGAAHPGLSERLRPPTYFPAVTMTERDAMAATGLDTSLIERRNHEGTRTMGGALVCALLLSAEERGVAVVAGHDVRALARGERVGWAATVRHDGHDRTVTAGAVVLASGGFEWNLQLQAAFLPNPVTPISAPSNEGDGLEMAMVAGAALGNMTAVWGVPVLQDPGHVYDGRQSGRMANVELTLPGSIMVNLTGRRFANEATNYHDLNKAFRTIDPATARHANIPAWMVYDSRYQGRYAVGGLPAGTPPPWAVRASSVRELAEQCGIDASALEATIEEFNRDSDEGIDRRFGRGSSPQDRHLGDPSNEPNPCLAPLHEAPFYGIPISPGTLGTCGGVVTDDEGRVLDAAAATIPGLYAAGNVSAAVFGDAYPGGGATLGSAVTRAYAVGRSLATRPFSPQP